MSSCKNCGANEFKDGKCSYCGTDYGLTGDKIQDEWLLAVRRKKAMEDEGWVFDRTIEGELIAKKGEFDCIFSYPANIPQAMADIWQTVIEEKYRKEFPACPSLK